MVDGATPREDGPPMSPVKAILAEIDAYKREYEAWHKRGKGIIDRYRDERGTTLGGAQLVERRFNILWSNTETLQPTLYARLPKVQVERRFKDADPIGKLACEIAERMGNYMLQTGSFDQVARACVKDALLPGRGVAWICYDSEGEEIPVDDKVTDETGAQVKTDAGAPKQETRYEKTQEAVEAKYVDWRDVFHSPVRTWAEVKMLGRNVYMSKPELEARFGAEKAKDIPLDRKQADDKNQTEYVVPQATIREVYYKPTRKVYWLHTGLADRALDEADVPVDFEGFWPCAKPLFATLTNDTLIPVPLFVMYQDQADELDVVTNRIGVLTRALKIVGVYDAEQPALERILAPQGTLDNTLVPVQGWAGFRDKGGVAGAIELVPVKQVAETLVALYEVRDQLKQVIYEITGIADVIRGASDPRETATAQNIKGQFASLRIKDMQAEVARFSRDNARLMIEAGVRMFEPRTIAQMVMAESFCPLSPQEQQIRMYAQTPMGQALLQGQEMPLPQSFQQALALLKDDRLRSFHIDIETDSTVAMDEQVDKKQAAEFMTTVGGFLREALPLAQTVPAGAPMVGEMLMFLVRRFRAGRSLESTIERTMQQLAQQAAQPKPDPKMAEVQGKLQMKGQEMQMKAANDQQERALDAADAKAEALLAAKKQKADTQIKAAAELSKVAPAAGAAALAGMAMQ